MDYNYYKYYEYDYLFRITITINDYPSIMTTNYFPILTPLNTRL